MKTIQDLNAQLVNSTDIQKRFDLNYRILIDYNFRFLYISHVCLHCLRKLMKGKMFTS